MKELTLENFRCYTNQSIIFKDGVNLLIGDNASGKTTILDACKYVLSSFFAGFSDENTKWISPNSNDFSQLITDGIIQPERPLKLKFILNSKSYYSPEKTLTLQKNSKKNSRALVSGILEYKKHLSAVHDFYTPDFPLPLIASFSTEDIHSSRKIDASRFTRYAQKPSFGYYECLEGNGFFSYWIKRLLVLQEGQKNLEEIEIVRNAIVDALGENGCRIIKDISIRPIQKRVYFIFPDGREVETEHLSDGYKRLVNIVMDIAFRCALLNRRTYKKESCKLSVGTALIDEIDLHLHPTLQALVVKGLRNAFPKIQLIITSHAPMVMTSVESNEENIVYKLDYSSNQGYEIKEVQTYGLDTSTITEDILNQTPRDLSVEKSLEALFDYIDNDDYERAKDLLTKLKNRFGDKLPELSKAEAMLNISL